MSRRAGGYVGPFRATSTSASSASGVWSLSDQQHRVSAGIWPPAALQYVLCATVSEGGTMTLTAPPGTIFASVQFASYGRPGGSCGSYSTGSCHYTSTVSVVNSYLLNKSGTQSIPVTNNVFSDRCVGSAKWLTVQVVCS